MNFKQNLDYKIIFCTYYSIFYRIGYLFNYKKEFESNLVSIWFLISQKEIEKKRLKKLKKFSNFFNL